MKNKIPYNILILGNFNLNLKTDKIYSRINLEDKNAVDNTIKKLSPSLYIPLRSSFNGGAFNLEFNSFSDFSNDEIAKKTGVDETKASQEKIEEEPSKESNDSTNNLLDDLLDMTETSKEDDTPLSGESIVKEILNSNDFLSLKTSFTGLNFLLDNLDKEENYDLSLFVSNFDKDDLDGVFNYIEKLKSRNLPNLIIYDHFFDNTPASNILVEKISDFSDKMMIPSVLSLSAKFFGIESWQHIGSLQYIKNLLDDISYSKFTKLKTSNKGDWLLTILPELKTGDEVINPAWLFASLVIKSISKKNRPTDFNEFSVHSRFSTEQNIDNNRYIQFIDSGIVPVTDNNNTLFLKNKTSVSGISFKFSLFLNRLISFLIIMSENKNRIDRPEKQVENCLIEFFENSNHQVPIDLETESDNLNGKNNTIQISFTLPPEIIKMDGKFSCSINW